MGYQDLHPDTLNDIETYAAHAINDLTDLQDKMRTNSRRMGFDGGFLLLAADMLDDIIHDALAPVLLAVKQAVETGIPQAAQIAAHRDEAAAFRRA